MSSVLESKYGCVPKTFLMILKYFSRNFLIVVLIYILDRVSKIYIIYLDEKNLGSEIFKSAYLNITLIWNKGFAFGLFSFDKIHLYNFLSLIIVGFIIILLIMFQKTTGFKRNSLLMFVGGALGILFELFFLMLCLIL